MATIKVPYLTKRPGKDGLPRYFWQPSAALRKEGWPLQRVPDNWASFTDAAALEAAAVAKAREINCQMAAARERKVVAGLPDVRPPMTRTLEDLIARYRASGDFTRLRPSTRRGYEQSMAIILRWSTAVAKRAGKEGLSIPVRALTAPAVQSLKEYLRKTPTTANAAVSILRLLLEHARRADWIQVNPAIKPKKFEVEPSGMIWPSQAIDRFVAAADAMGRPSIGTAVLLDEWIGQRQGDVLALPRSIWRAGQLAIRQSKTGAGVSLPIDRVPRLKTRLEAELVRQEQERTERERHGLPAPAPLQLIVSEETGRPYLPDNFRHLFAEVRAAMADAMREEKGWRRDKAGVWSHPAVDDELRGSPPAERSKRLAAELRRAASFEVDNLLPGRRMEDPEAFLLCADDLQFLHLRHTAVTRLAEAGCDVLQIAAVTGHTPKSVTAIMERYMIRTRKLAQLAFDKRLEAETQGAPPSGVEKAR